jgi:hypothetical protein
MRSTFTRRGLRPSRLLEALEPRTLFSTDLSGSFTHSPDAFFSGSRQAVTLKITNDGNTNARGTLAVAFYADLDGVIFNPNTAVSLGRVTRSANIAPDGNFLVTTNLTFSTAFQAGSYRIYAVITPAKPADESDSSNNTAVSDAFTIAQPNYDLTADFASSAFLPPAIVTGIQSRATIRVTITNPSDSTAKIPSGQRITVQVVARPVGASDASNDVVLRTQLVSVSSLRPGRSTTVALPLTFPSTLPAGEYDIIVNADTTSVFAETNETNNSATFDSTLIVATPFVDPKLTFNAATTLPPSVVADGRILPLKFDLANLGNVKFPGNQTSSISLIAVNKNTGATSSFATLTVNLAGIAPGKTKTFTLKPTVPTSGLAYGEYTLQASLSTTASGDQASNNTDSCTQTLSVDPAFYNIAVGTITDNFTHALNNDAVNSGTINVRVQNQSNTIIPAGTNAVVTLVLHPLSAGSQDIQLGTFNKSLSGLAVGATRSLSMNVSIPANASVGDYVVLATVSPANLVESSTGDNSALSTDPITISTPFTDLAIQSAITNFPSPSAIGSRAMGTVVIRNTGTLPVYNAQQQVHVRFMGHARGSAVSIGLGDGYFNLSLAPGASSIPLNVALELDLPNDNTLSTYVDVRAEIVNADAFGDTRITTNNSASAGTVLVSYQCVDLQVHTGTDPFPASALANATASAQATVINVGSGLSTGSVTVKYFASASGTLDGSQILIGSTTTGVTLLQTQISSPISVPLSLASLSAGSTYHLFVQITAAAGVDNISTDNVLDLDSTITILPPSGG